MPGGNGRPSKRQTSRTHHDSTGQSGQPRRSQPPSPRRGNGGGSGFGQSVADAIFGPGPRSTSHGGSSKNRKKKGGGSR